MADTILETPKRSEEAADKVGTHVRAATERTADIGRETTDKIASDATRVMGRNVEMGSKAMHAYAEAGQKTSTALSEVSQAATDAFNRRISDFQEISNAAITCRTPQDLVRLHSVAIQKMQDHVGDVMRIYGMYVDALTKLVDTSPATPLDSRDKAINAVS